MGGVFSQAEGYNDLVGLTVAASFHAVCMGLGIFLVGRAARARKAAVA